jgi:hypothetical protein
MGLPRKTQCGNPAHTQRSCHCKRQQQQGAAPHTHFSNAPYFLGNFHHTTCTACPSSGEMAQKTAMHQIVAADVASQAAMENIT